MVTFSGGFFLPIVVGELQAATLPQTQHWLLLKLVPLMPCIVTAVFLTEKESESHENSPFADNVLIVTNH